VTKDLAVNIPGSSSVSCSRFGRLMLAELEKAGAPAERVPRAHSGR
jgi:hypothetical protein